MRQATSISRAYAEYQVQVSGNESSTDGVLILETGRWLNVNDMRRQTLRDRVSQSSQQDYVVLGVSIVIECGLQKGLSLSDAGVELYGVLIRSHARIKHAR